MAGQGGPSSLDEARRQAGVASNNLEASLSRALQEPRGQRSRRRIELLLAADAALRRLGGGFLALRYDPAARQGIDIETWGSWAEWIPSSLELLAHHRAGTGPMPYAPPKSTLARLGRAMALLNDLVLQVPQLAEVPGSTDRHDGPESSDLR